MVLNHRLSDHRLSSFPDQTHTFKSWRLTPSLRNVLPQEVWLIPRIGSPRMVMSLNSDNESTGNVQTSHHIPPPWCQGYFWKDNDSYLRTITYSIGCHCTYHSTWEIFRMNCLFSCICNKGESEDDFYSQCTGSHCRLVFQDAVWNNCASLYQWLKDL